MKSEHVKQLTQRHDSLAWLATVAEAYPMGIVPIPTAARVLGVTPQRVRSLIRQGRLTLINGMPGGIRNDQFIPVKELINAPFAMTRGRPGVFGPKNRPQYKKEEKYYEYQKSLATSGLQQKEGSRTNSPV